NAYNAFDASGAAEVTLSNSRISDTGVLAYSGSSGPAVSIGDAGVANGNLVQRSAYSSIAYSGTGGTKVSNNVVEDSCLRLADGAGIYTFNGPNRTSNQSSRVEGNIV